MKHNDTQTNVPRTDAVYVECLLRSNLDEHKALEILRHKRPNLVCFIFKKSKIYFPISIRHHHLLQNQFQTTLLRYHLLIPWNI
jgi:hypothetical protein